MLNLAQATTPGLTSDGLRDRMCSCQPILYYKNTSCCCCHCPPPRPRPRDYSMFRPSSSGLLDVLSIVLLRTTHCFVRTILYSTKKIHQPNRTEPNQTKPRHPRPPSSLAPAPPRPPRTRLACYRCFFFVVYLSIMKLSYES